MTDYNMAFDANFSDYMPFALGDPRRVPFRYYHHFGIKKNKKNLEIGRAAYSSEWERSGPIQNELISAAAIEAGLGDHSAKLRSDYARFVADLFEIKKQNGKITYVETGAGKSTEVLFEELKSRGFDFDGIKSYLIEPSENRIQIAVEHLESLGLERGKHFIPIVGRNYDILNHIEPCTVDILGSLATDHHEPEQSYPRQIEYRALKSGGVKVNFDWGPPNSYHPSYFYKALFFSEEVDKVMGDRWPTKKQDRETYERLFPLCLEEPPELNPRDQKALSEFTRYWSPGFIIGKMKIVEDGRMEQKGDPNDFFAFESHSTAEDVTDVYEKVGFQANTKDIKDTLKRSGIKAFPYFPIEGSGILFELVMQKPKE